MTIWLEDDPDADVLRYAVMVRFGRYFRDSMPDCGCDACSGGGFESVERLTDDLRLYLRAVSSTARRLGGSLAGLARTDPADAWRVSMDFLVARVCRRCAAGCSGPGAPKLVRTVALSNPRSADPIAGCEP